MWGGFSLKKNQRLAIIDIGTSSAAVAVISVTRGVPSTIEASHRIFFSASGDQKNSAAAVASMVKEAGAKVHELLVKKNPGTHTVPHGVYIFARAPWSHSTTRRVVERFTEDIKITPAELEEKSKKVLNDITGINASQLLEASVTRVEVNGYATPRPLGKHGHILAATVLASDVDPVFKQAISEAATALFPKSKPEWRTHTRAIMALLREHADDFRDALVVDIATENSDFVVVKDGVLTQQVTAHEGAHAILSRISSGGMQEETLSLLRMFERDQCSSDACIALKESLGRTEADLVKVFGDTLGKMAASGRLPTKLLLLTIPDMAPWLSRFFSRIDFSQFTVTAQPFSTAIINAENLKNWVASTPGVNVDVSLLLACALVHIEHHASK